MKELSSVWKIPRTAVEIGRFLLIVLVSIGPWLNGGADPLPQAVLFALAMMIAVCLFIDAWRSDSGKWVSWTSLLATGGIVLGLIHLAPIWSTAPKASAPSAVQLRVTMTGRGEADRTLASEKPLVPAASVSDLPARVPLTLDAHATRQTIAMICLALIVLLAAHWWLDSSDQLAKFARVLAINGVLLTLFAVLAKATWNGKLYWVIPLGFGRGVFGSIVYHNQAGGILMMTSAAALALLVGLKPSNEKTKSTNGSLNGGHIALASGRWQWPETNTMFLWAVLGLNLAGLLLTLSRGALLATLFSGVVALFWIRPNQGWRGVALPLGLSIAGALGLVIWFRASDAVSQRYSTLMRSEKLLEDTRLEHWQDGLRAGQDHGLLGVGMGAYRHIHLLYQDGEIERVFLRAHNQYLETWVDSGIPGLILLILILLSTFSLLRWLAARREPPLRAAALLGVLVVVGQMLHALVDFCLYLPATAVMFAAIIGSLGRIAWNGMKLRQQPTKSLGAIAKTWALRTAVGLLLFGSVWSTWSGVRWTREDIAIYSAPWNDRNTEIAPDVLSNAMRKLETCLPTTDDWRVPLALGELTIVDFRQRLFAELVEELNANGPTELSPQEIWSYTDPTVLHGRSHLLAATGNQASIDEEILDKPLIRDLLAKAHNQFRFARSLCPLNAQVHLRLAELDFLRQKPDYDQSKDLLRVTKISVGNPDLLFEAGRRMATAGRDAEAIATWRESLDLSPRHWSEIYQLVGVRMSAKDMLEKLLPDDPKLLLSIAGKQFTETEQQNQRKMYLDRADELLGTTPPTSRDDRVAWHLSRTELELLREKYTAAEQHLAAAVKLKPDDHSLRAQYARLLGVEKRFDEAIQEANYCLGLQPNNWDYRGLLETLRKQKEEAVSD